MTITPLPADFILRPRSQNAIYFAAETLPVFITLMLVYVAVPSFGLLHSSPASYGILIGISIYFATHTLLKPRMALLYAPLFMILATSEISSRLRLRSCLSAGLPAFDAALGHQGNCSCGIGCPGGLLRSL